MNKLKFYNVVVEIISKYNENEKYMAVSDNWLLPKNGDTKDTLDLNKRPEARLTFKTDEHTTKNMAVADLIKYYNVKVKNVELHGYYENGNLTLVNHNNYYHI